MDISIFSNSSLTEKILSSYDSTDISNISRDNIIIQSPDVVIYKNNINVFKGSLSTVTYGKDAQETGDKFKDVLKEPQRQKKFEVKLVSLSINADINSEPGTATIQFALPTIDTDSKVTFVSELDFPDESDRWYLMDHIQIWISPNVKVLPYIRSFVGCVTSLSYEIHEYQFILTVQLKDMMFWLDQARVQTKWSMFDLAFRRPNELLHGEDQLAWITYKNRFAGLNFRHLIEKVLFNRRVKDLPKEQITGSKVELNQALYDEYENEDFTLLPLYSGGDILAVTSLLGVNHNPTAKSFSYSESFRRAVTSKISNYNKSIEQIPKGSEGNSSLLKETVSKPSINQPITINDISGGFTQSIADIVELRAIQRRNYQAISLYWELAFFRYLRENYCAILRDEDIALMPFPWESDAQTPLLFEGTFSSRSQILKNLSEQTLYEIYQSNQGLIFVKPPLYNAPPINSIKATEISDITKQENMHSILTSATTEGIIVWKNPEESKGVAKATPQITIPKGDSPFVLGTYQILFPKNIQLAPLNSVDFKSNENDMFRIPINSMLSYREIINSLKRDEKRFKEGSLVIKIKEDIKTESGDFGTQIVSDASLSNTNPTLLANVMLYKMYYKALDPSKVAQLESGFDVDIFKSDNVPIAASLFFSFIEEWLVQNQTHFGITDTGRIRSINQSVLSLIHI